MPPQTNYTMMKLLSYYAIYAVCFLVSLPPLWFLYRISDGLYYILYYVVRYRRPLVRKNLTESFPEKDETEIIRIEKNFYAWLCDYFFETLKMMTIGKREIMKRMRFEGVEQINESIGSGVSCTLYLGHYCNWEWITTLPLHIQGGERAHIYHPLENDGVNRVFLKLRGRFGSQNIDMDSAFRMIVSWDRNNKHSTVGYIADQVPGLQNVHCWVDFLNHDTPVFTGVERITRIIGAEVFYSFITRPRRGYYVCTFKRIAMPEGGYVKFHFTKEYFRLLEENIRHAPQYWLWSHNRWKRTREQFNREHTPEERQRMLNRL